MGMRDDIMEVKKQLEEIKNESFAMELISDYKAQNKRQFIIILVILSMFGCLLAYTIWLLNDIGTIETTQEISDVDTINGTVVNQGDVYGENKTEN